MVIKPEPSRHVHFIPASDVSGGGTFTAGQPHAGIIAHVHSDRMVNLLVIDKNGWPVSRTSVPLLQPGDVEPAAGSYDYCRWMPHTVAQAEKQMAATLAAFDAATPAADDEPSAG